MKQRTVVVWKVPATDTKGARMRCRYNGSAETKEIGYPHAAADPHLHVMQTLWGDADVTVLPGWRDTPDGYREYRVQAEEFPLVTCDLC